MQADIDKLVWSINLDLDQYDPTNLLQQAREAIGAGLLQAAANKRDAIQRLVDDPLVPDGIREYARRKLDALPAF